MLKFIHAADIHLDSPLSGLERYEGAPVDAIRGATRRALEKLVQLAVDEGVAFVLIAGDVYDGDWPDYNTGLFFSCQMARLREAGIRVVTVAGNHDAQSRITRTLKLPDNVTQLSAGAPETVILEDLGVAIHGQSFATPAVTDDLSRSYPEALPERFNVGLLHTSLTGRPGHAPYAPTTLDVLRGKGYDYWALGHVHTREVVHENPWVVFPGNIQGRHVHEDGAKGCTLVGVQGTMVQKVEHRELDVVRWQQVTVDADGAVTAFDVVERVAAAVQETIQLNGGRLSAIRLRVEGACEAHRELAAQTVHWEHQIRARISDVGGDRVWLEKIRWLTRTKLDLDDMAARDDAMGGLVRAILSLGEDQTQEAMADDLFGDLKGKLVAGLGSHAPQLVGDDPDLFAAALQDVKQLLAARLIDPGGEG